jgi:hypothetical protein
MEVYLYPCMRLDGKLLPSIFNLCFFPQKFEGEGTLGRLWCSLPLSPNVAPKLIKNVLPRFCSTQNSSSDAEHARAKTMQSYPEIV